MKKKKVVVPVIALYGLAVVFLLIGAFEIWFSYDYVSGLTTQGFSISENMKDVFNYYFTQSAPHFASAFLLYTGAVIISYLKDIQDRIGLTDAVVVEAPVDEEEGIVEPVQSEVVEDKKIDEEA